MSVTPNTQSEKHAVDVPAWTPTLPAVLLRRRTYALYFIMAVGFAIRLYGIAVYSLAGDEYNSLAEAKWVGLNWNSIIYFAVMHLWMQLGTSEVWLRLPATIFGVATIPVLFKVGERLDGWRTGTVAALLAAISPFNVYHSQEVRFYSLFMFAASLSLLAAVHYVQSERTIRDRLSMVSASLLLLVTHFLGLIALWAQGVATFLSIKRRRPATALAVTVGIPLVIFGLPLLPPVRAALISLYQVFGNAEHAANVEATSVSVLSLVRIGFTGFTFTFGYHIYPLRLFLIVIGAVLTTLLIIRGSVRLVRERKWATLALTHAIALVGIFTVLDAVGGRVASGVSPRHVAFVWPVFTLLLALGLTSFHKMVFKFLLVAVMIVNAVCLVAAWTKDWSYAAAADYRAAADFASRGTLGNTLLVYGSRAGGPTEFYFPGNLPRVDWVSYLQSRGDVSAHDRVIIVSDDWRPTQRKSVEQALRRLREGYVCIDGRVDFPLFEYLFERRPTAGSRVPTNGSTTQLELPLNLYGLEFQDLKLPVAVDAKGAHVRVIGATELPNSDGENVVRIAVPAAATRRLVLLTSVTRDQSLSAGTVVAEVIVENKSEVVARFPLRLGIETAPWDQTCAPSATCQTVFHWHKRLVLTGQNSYPGAWRDFQAGMHAVAWDLPVTDSLETVSIRYVASSGKAYVWGIAVY